MLYCFMSLGNHPIEQGLMRVLNATGTIALAAFF